MPHQPQYTIIQDRDSSVTLSFPERYQAILQATRRLEMTPADKLTTITVVNEDDYLLAVLTNRRIEGVFTKQYKSGWKQKDIDSAGDVTFDATDAVLLTRYEDLIEMYDGSEIANDLGRDHVDWDGPFEVSVTQAICDYFGVENLKDITPEALEFVREHAKPQPFVEKLVTLTIQVKTFLAPGKDVSEFVDNLDYSIVSKTSGIVVRGTEIVASN